jgi:hypothetical protein
MSFDKGENEKDERVTKSVYSSETARLMESRRASRYENLTKIITALLRQRECDTGQLADFCGYSGNRKYEAITPALDNLHRRGYLERKTAPSSTGSSQESTWYNIKKDLTVIAKIYSDRQLQPIPSEFRESKWLRDLILEERFHFLKSSVESQYLEPLRNDIRYMLKFSRTFFEYNLKYQITPEILRFWPEGIETPLPVLAWKSEWFTSRDRMAQAERQEFPPYLIHNFFIFCLFSEYIEAQLQGKDLPEMRKEWEWSRDLSSQFRKRLREFESTIQIISVLQNAAKKSGDEKLALEYTLKTLDHYGQVKDSYVTYGGPSSDSDFKLNDLYQGIAEKLGIKIRREAISRDLFKDRE